MADDKLKILYLMKMLLDEMDRDHPMNAAEIAEKMMNTPQFQELYKKLSK